MSIIQATFDTNNKSWTLTESNPNVTHIDLQIVFVSDKEITVFNNLRYGYTLTTAGFYHTGEFPHAGTVESARNTPLLNERIVLTSNTEYTLVVWAENEGVRTNSQFVFSTPVPPKPYESWSWSGSEWLAPIPMPEIGEPNEDGSTDAYVWSEKQQKWFLMVPPLSQYDDI